MKVDHQLLEKLEQLSRLQLSADEKENIIKDINNILVMAETLQKVDTTNVEPLVYMTDEFGDFREDVIKNQVDKKIGLSNAPDADSDYFKVPTVIAQ